MTSVSATGRVILVGAPSVGKTCLLHRYMKGEWLVDSHPTVSIDCNTMEQNVEGTIVKLILFDTAGQERFDSITPAYYRNADVCILCCDLSDPEGLQKALPYMKKVSAENPTADFIVAGTKSDIFYPSLDVDQLNTLCREQNIMFYVTSALTSDGDISALFNAAASVILRRTIENRAKEAVDRISPSIDLNDTSKPSDTRLCKC